MKTMETFPPLDSRRLNIALLNGPNMSNLGKRDPNIYGSIGSLRELVELVTDAAARLGVDITPFSSNHEGDLVGFIENGAAFDAYILNPGGLWAFGQPTRLALAECGRPFVEVHFANIFATGHESIFTKFATGTVMGFRQHGYIGALVALVTALRSSAAESARAGAAEGAGTGAAEASGRPDAAGQAASS